MTDTRCPHCHRLHDEFEVDRIKALEPYKQTVLKCREIIHDWHEMNTPLGPTMKALIEALNVSPEGNPDRE